MQETDFPFEIIIRDDCSTDKTADIVREYAKKFPHIIKTIFETENQYSKGINPFIPVYETAKGKYVTILEGDDYWRDKLKLQKQYDFLEKNDKFVLSYHNSIIVDDNNNLISKMKNPSPRDYTQNQMLCGEAFILTNTVMFRKVISLSQSQFKNVLSGDTFMWHLLGYHGKSKYQENIDYAAYRVHSSGIWSSLDEIEKFKNTIKLKYTLKNKLPDSYSKLKKRIVKSINRVAVNLLYESIRVLDFKAFKSILKLIFKSEDLSIFKVLLQVPGFLFQKIKRQYLKLISKKI
jgi:glycosyltransferase involved in cell wall biosynthesis